ncbi:hypothetical protein LJC46_08450 [Desulfovibrio sp. OttesenSCG-928-G15]|nr:hypothetical protein [Desulfovibrio sp. OttesenSCG-928-G15]
MSSKTSNEELYRASCIAKFLRYTVEDMIDGDSVYGEDVAYGFGLCMQLLIDKIDTVRGEGGSHE